MCRSHSRDTQRQFEPHTHTKVFEGGRRRNGSHEKGVSRPVRWREQAPTFSDDAAHAQCVCVCVYRSSGTGRGREKSKVDVDNGVRRRSWMRNIDGRRGIQEKGTSKLGRGGHGQGGERNGAEEGQKN